MTEPLSSKELTDIANIAERLIVVVDDLRLDDVEIHLGQVEVQSGDRVIGHLVWDGPSEEYRFAPGFMTNQTPIKTGGLMPRADRGQQIYPG